MKTTSGLIPVCLELIARNVLMDAKQTMPPAHVPRPNASFIIHLLTPSGNHVQMLMPSNPRKSYIASQLVGCADKDSWSLWTAGTWYKYFQPYSGWQKIGFEFDGIGMGRTYK